MYSPGNGEWSSLLELIKEACHPTWVGMGDVHRDLLGEVISKLRYKMKGNSISLDNESI